MEILKSKYELQAIDFLTKNRIVFGVRFTGNVAPPWEEWLRATSTRKLPNFRWLAILQRRDNWSEVGSVKEDGTGLQVDFWTHLEKYIKSTGDNGPVTPTAYDVLACISSDVSMSDNFGNWCSDFGWDTDSRKALATFERCKELAAKLKAFFTADELEQLEEIR
jgi:hypothetical protein